MLHRNARRVAQPRGNNVDRVFLRQFRFAACMAWNSRGQGFRPARITSRSNRVRKLQFRQPLGVLARGVKAQQEVLQLRARIRMLIALLRVVLVVLK